jgi:hypothetical protein
MIALSTEVSGESEPAEGVMSSGGSGLGRSMALRV